MGGGAGALAPVAVMVGVGVVTGISQPVFWFATFVMIAGLFFTPLCVIPFNWFNPLLADSEIVWTICLQCFCGLVMILCLLI